MSAARIGRCQFSTDVGLILSRQITAIAVRPPATAIPPAMFSTIQRSRCSAGMARGMRRHHALAGPAATMASRAIASQA
jgi:hypothetical protein